MFRRTFLIAAAAASLTLASGAFAHEYKAGALTIMHPWARATPAGAKVGGAYLSVVNSGKEADTLLSVSADVSGNAQIHEMTMENGVSRMRHLEGGLAIPARQTVTLKPGGFHVMLMDLKQPLAKGETVKGSLVFEKAGKVDVEFVVQDVGAQPSAEHQHMSQ